MAHVFDDYHPIAGPLGEIFDKFCSMSYSSYFDDYHPIAGPPREFFDNSKNVPPLYNPSFLVLFFWSYMRSRELHLREREIVFLVVHEISDDYHLAGPPGEIFEISLYDKSVHDFGALRQIRAWLYMRSPTIITLLAGLQEIFSKFRSTTNPCMILELYD